MYKYLLKRLIDIVISVLLMPFLLLEIIIFAPIIWMVDRGPVFYNAQRLGKGGEPFKMYKLRSMYVNSPDLRFEDGSTFNSKDDDRVTPIGRILRNTSLDEFPQVLNVLLGNMSLVGPRPTVGKINPETFIGDIKKRYDVRPGITGYTQAYYRNSIPKKEKLKYDAYYVDHLSFCLDVKVIWQTVKSILRQENINADQNPKLS